MTDKLLAYTLMDALRQLGLKGTRADAHKWTKVAICILAVICEKGI
jgi:hypothetical protein